MASPNSPRPRTRTDAELPDAAELARHADAAAALLKSMANPHRLQVLCALGDGEMSVGALNQRIGLSQSALSQHLAVLRADGLVETRREAQTIHYRVVPGIAAAVIRLLHDHFCGAPRSGRRSGPKRA
ncbi:MAG TPA: metalloregulator ArsR/SmtB family transcription factor [Xanthomonadales bacterium]|nr:metalloregulator ArsR/SmtB family transcription factor [Xanthomonadales bacterium]